MLERRKSIIINYDEAQLMLKALTAYRFFPFHRCPHPWFTEDQNRAHDVLHEKIAMFRDRYITQGSTAGDSLELDALEITQIITALADCAAEMWDNHNDLHTMLDLDDAEPLRELAVRLQVFQDTLSQR